MTKDIQSIRNLTLVGHGGSGKTTLAEALLKEVGLATRLPAGIMDYNPDEKEREHSIDSAIAQFTWKDKNFTVIDSPGYQDFIHNSIGALSVVESAVILVSASDGVTVNSRKMWRASQKNNQARIIVITKLDGDNVNLEDTVKEIQENFNEKCLPVLVPNTASNDFTSVINVFEDGGNFADYKDSLVEAIVETNDEMMEKYLEGEEISSKQLREQLKKAVHKGKISPIFVVSPVKEIGIKEFLQTMADLAPSPADVGKRQGHAPGNEEEIIERAADPNEPFSGQVFKVFNDPFGRICYFRVYSGTLNANSSVYIPNSDQHEKLGHLLKVRGKDHENVDKVCAGEIVAVGKTENLLHGDTLCEEKNAIVYPKPEYPSPMVQLAVKPLSRGDEQKISSALNKLLEEDPTFQAHRNEETSELVVSGMSNLHFDIMLNRLKSRYKVECSTELPRIPYRETIQGKTDTRFRHKKQSGGSGQFAEVAIKMEPSDRGQGLDFVNQIVGGVIPAPFIESCKKGMIETMKRGVLAKYPVIDVRVMLYDGKTHDVDSSDAAFQIAASKAFQQAFLECKPVLMEPIYEVAITVPSESMGDIMGDLNSRRGRIMGSDAQGDYQVVKAHVPHSEIMTYSTELKAMTGGEGSYTAVFSHYDVVPPNIQEKIVAGAKKEEAS